MSLSAILTNCDRPEASAEFLVFPSNENTRTFGNGDARFIHLNTFGEPAAGASRILIQVRKRFEFSFVCRLATIAESVGFSDVDLPNARSSFDPEIGLRVEVPVRAFDGEVFGDYILNTLIHFGDETIEVDLQA